jgi:hypothetical protein
MVMGKTRSLMVTTGKHAPNDGFGDRPALSAYYWLRLAEASSRELGHRSRALVEQLGSAGKKHEIEDVEHRISIAVKNSKLLKSQRPAEFIKQGERPLPLRVAI